MPVPRKKKLSPAKVVAGLCHDMTIRKTETLYGLVKDEADGDAAMTTGPVKKLLPEIATQAYKPTHRRYLHSMIVNFGVACDRQRAAGKQLVTLNYGEGKFGNFGGKFEDPLSQTNTPDGELEHINEQMFEILKKLGRSFTVRHAIRVLNSPESVFTAKGYPEFKFNLAIGDHWAYPILTSQNFKNKDFDRPGLNMQRNLQHWHDNQTAASTSSSSIAQSSSSESHANQAERDLLLADREQAKSYKYGLWRYDSILPQPFPSSARHIFNLRDLKLAEVESLKDNLRHLVWSGYAQGVQGMRALIWDRCLIAIGREPFEVLLSNAFRFIEGRDHATKSDDKEVQDGNGLRQAFNSKGKGKRKASPADDSEIEMLDDGELEEMLPQKVVKRRTSTSDAKAKPNVSVKGAKSTSQSTQFHFRSIMEASIGERSDIFEPFPDDRHPSLAEHPMAVHFERFNVRSPERLYTEYAPGLVQAPSMPDIHSYRQLIAFVAYYTGNLAEGEADNSPDICWVISEYDDEERQATCVKEAIKLIAALKTAYNARVASEGCFHPKCYLNRANGLTPSVGAPNPYRPHEVLCLAHAQECIFVKKQLGIQTWQGYLDETEECTVSRMNPGSAAYVYSVESLVNSFKGCDGQCDEDLFAGPSYARATRSSSGEGTPHTGAGWGYCKTCAVQDTDEAKRQARGVGKGDVPTVIEPWVSHNAVRAHLCPNPHGRKDCVRFAPQQTPRRGDSPKHNMYGYLVEHQWLCRVCIEAYGKLVRYGDANYAPMRRQIQRALESRNTLRKVKKLPIVDIYRLLHGLSTELMPGSFVSVGAMVRSLPELRETLLVHKNEAGILREISQLGMAST